jgi:hypothetical protein
MHREDDGARIAERDQRLGGCGESVVVVDQLGTVQRD